MSPIAISTDVDISKAEAAIREALAEQGFGVLTEIDIAATDVDETSDVDEN